MPNLCSRSAATMRSVCVSVSRVIAAGTAASGRCVVASATRSEPHGAAPTSSMTTAAAPVRCARNSVWPVKWMPASLMHAFLHRRRDHRVEFAGQAPDDRGIEQGDHRSGVGRIEPSCLHRHRNGKMRDFERPGRGGAAAQVRHQAHAGAEPCAPARAGVRNRRASTSRAGHARSARRTVRSGPIPAGSPMVTTIVGAVIAARLTPGHVDANAGRVAEDFDLHARSSRDGRAVGG